MIWLLFILIQAVSLLLTVLGLPVCAALAAFWFKRLGTANSYDGSRHIFVFPRWAWIWSNAEDGVAPPGYASRWGVFVWTALRNPCNNLRFVRGVSGKGRPLIQRAWQMFGKSWYYQIGWTQDNGWPVASAGRLP